MAPAGRPHEVRWQRVLKKSGHTWIPGNVGFSTSPRLEFTPLTPATLGTSSMCPAAPYEPRAIQATNGRIFVFGHVGGDDA